VVEGVAHTVRAGGILYNKPLFKKILKKWRFTLDPVSKIKLS